MRFDGVFQLVDRFYILLSYRQSSVYDMSFTDGKVIKNDCDEKWTLTFTRDLKCSEVHQTILAVY